jgi:threonine/homoserine/homoserine lactone efflux protein
MPEVILSGLLLGLAIALPVGPVITAIIRSGLRGGFLQAWLVGLGAAASHGVLVALTLLGVVTVLDRPIWHLVLGGAGVLMLGYLGVDALRGGTELSPATEKTAAGQPFVVGFSIGIANPITIVWFLTVGGGLMAAHAGRGTGSPAVAFGLSFVAGVLLWDTVVAGLSGLGRRRMGPRAFRGLNLLAAAVFFGFAVRLAWRVMGLLG